MSALGSWHFFCVLFAKAMKYKYKFKINRYLKSKSEKSVANRLTKCSLRCIFLLASRQRKP